MGRKPVRDERREQILEGLFQAMATVGARGASVTEIGKAAGISRGALHYYFSSKDEIRVALMERLGQQYADGLAAALDRAEARAPDDKAAPLRALVRYHFSGEEDRIERLLSVWIDYWGQAPSDSALGAVVLDVQERARQLCLRALLSLRPELKALFDDEKRHVAAALLALIEGGLLQWRVARATRPLDLCALSARITDAALAFADRIDAPKARAKAPRKGTEQTGGAHAHAD